MMNCSTFRIKFGGTEIESQEGCISGTCYNYRVYFAVLTDRSNETFRGNRPRSFYIAPFLF